MSQSPPKTLGKYQIIREIARSNDIVYEGYDPAMNRRVALKELAVPPGSTPQQFEDRLKRFLREAKAAGSLAHPNVVTIFEVGEQDGRNFLAMEYLDGHTLRNELDTRGFLEPEAACKIALEVLSALDYAHKNGVIHRDIKPENIQLLSDGRVKLTDFGIARLTFEPNLTVDGQVFGTPSYMSPEQVVGRDIDARSDLFSVGVILYEMLSGQKPFMGDSVVTITYSILNKEPDRPKQINFALWQVLGQALDKSPALRFSSASEMASAVKNALDASLAGPVLDPAILPNPYYPPVPGATQLPTSLPPLYNYGAPMQNPYSAQPPYPPVQLPSNPIPVYYPPPPRKPIFTPPVKMAIARIFVAIIVLSSAFALIIVLLQTLFGNEPNDLPGATRPAPQANRLASDSVTEGGMVGATLNQEASAFAERGNEMRRQAEGSDSLSQRAKLLGEAAHNLGEAFRLESEPATKASYGEDAASALLSLARVRLDAGERREARRLLNEARTMVALGSPTDDKIVELLGKVE